MTTAQLPTTHHHPRALFSGLMHAPATLAKRISRRQKFRRTFLPLLQERDQILSDIGYQRYDILRALRLPLHEDAMGYIESRRLNGSTGPVQTKLPR